jgi:hypothetical protein
VGGGAEAWLLSSARFCDAALATFGRSSLRV